MTDSAFLGNPSELFASSGLSHPFQSPLAHGSVQGAAAQAALTTTDSLVAAMPIQATNARAFWPNLSFQSVSGTQVDTLQQAWQQSEAQLRRWYGSDRWQEDLSTIFQLPADSFPADSLGVSDLPADSLTALQSQDSLLTSVPGQLPVSLVPRQQLQAKGVFAADNQQIYLAQEWLDEHRDRPDAVASVLLEELGHAIDHQFNRQLGRSDTPGDEGALFSARVRNQTLSEAELAAIQLENDHAEIVLDGQRLSVEQSGLGEFTVGDSGQIQADLILDGGAYQGQLAVFSLTGLETLTPGSPEYIQEAARRALSNSAQGHVLLSDGDGARLSGTLPGDLGAGAAPAPRNVALTAGDRVALMLVPNGTVQEVFAEPDAGGSLRPLFSVPAANPGGLEQFAQVSDGVIAIEDMRRDRRTDNDFEDFIVAVRGVSGDLGAIETLVAADENWLDGPGRERLTPLPELSPEPSTQPIAAPTTQPIAPIPISVQPPEPTTSGPTFSESSPVEFSPVEFSPAEPTSPTTPPTTPPEPTSPEPTPPELSNPTPVAPILPESSPPDPLPPEASPLESPRPAIAAVESERVTKFYGDSSEAEIADLNAPSITLGSQTIYIGTQQATAVNQNPIVRSFDSENSANNWTRTDYEVTGADGRGQGLFWSGQDLYGVFTVDGAQGTPQQDFRRAADDAEQSWLRSYGQGGGGKIAVLGRIDLATGELLDAAHLSAILSNGDSNSFTVDDISLSSSGNLIVQATIAFAPRNPDGSRMRQVVSGSSPFDYQLEITPDLKRVVSTSAEGWVPV